MKTKIYLLIIENKQTKTASIGPFLEILKNEGLDPQVKRLKADATLHYKEFIPGKWGLKDIKTQLAPIVQKRAYHAVVFYYEPHTDKPLCAWSRGLPFYSGEDSVFIEIPTQDGWGDWDWRALAHEMGHGFHKMCWWNKIWTVDTMDANALEGVKGMLRLLPENLDRVRPYLSHILRPPAQVPILEALIKRLLEAVGLLTRAVEYTQGLEPQKDAVSLPMEPEEPKPVNLPNNPPMKTVSKLELWAEAIKQFEGWNPGSVSYRNNNPGNVRSVAGPFKKFLTYEEGWNYLLDYLTRAATGKHAAYRPDMNLQEFFGVYAPSSDGNHPNNYANFVGKKIGVDIKTKIKDLV